jgi:hypothetical protein
MVLHPLNQPNQDLYPPLLPPTLSPRNTLSPLQMGASSRNLVQHPLHLLLPLDPASEMSTPGRDLESVHIARLHHETFHLLEGRRFSNILRGCKRHWRFLCYFATVLAIEKGPTATTAEKGTLCAVLARWHGCCVGHYADSLAVHCSEDS